MEKELTNQQVQVLLTLVSGKNITETAKKHKITEPTIYNWLNSETFKAEHRRMRREVVESSLSILQSTTEEAVAALRKNLSCGNPTAENAAAKAILEFSIKGVEVMDLEEKIAKLSKLAEELK